MSDTPRTDREVYKGTERDIGFEFVNPSLCRMMERELAEAQRLADMRAHQLAQWRDLVQSLVGVDANDHGWLRAELESQWRARGDEPIRTAADYDRAIDALNLRPLPNPDDSQSAIGRKP